MAYGMDPFFASGSYFISMGEARYLLDGKSDIKKT